MWKHKISCQTYEKFLQKPSVFLREVYGEDCRVLKAGHKIALEVASKAMMHVWELKV
jgi:hypothetical protein